MRTYSRLAKRGPLLACKYEEDLPHILISCVMLVGLETLISVSPPLAIHEKSLWGAAQM